MKTNLPKAICLIDYLVKYMRGFYLILYANILMFLLRVYRKRLMRG